MKREERAFLLYYFFFIKILKIFFFFGCFEYKITNFIKSLEKFATLACPCKLKSQKNSLKSFAWKLCCHKSKLFIFPLTVEAQDLIRCSSTFTTETHGNPVLTLFFYCWNISSALNTVSMSLLHLFLFRLSRVEGSFSSAGPLCCNAVLLLQWWSDGAS